MRAGALASEVGAPRCGRETGMRRTPAETRALWLGLLRAAGPIVGVVALLVAPGIFIVYQATSLVFHR